MSRSSPDTVPVMLALQGGGSHGALAWGVLDCLLTHPGTTITALSGTSAGAMNASLTAAGLATGGPDAARAALNEYWHAVSRAGRFSPVQRTVFDRLSDNWSLDRNPAYLALDFLSRAFSPYQSNPANFHPLRRLLEEQLDIDALNHPSAPRVFLTATNVRTGMPHVFTQPDLSIDVLLASAALPNLFQAVEIGGEAYWDGGYTGNPALYPLVRSGLGQDLILVQTNPFFRPDVPRTAREIANRLNEVTFNAALLKELRFAMHFRDLVPDIDATRLHRVLSDDDLAGYAPSSKMNVEQAYLDRLFRQGHARAEVFLAKHGQSLGVAQTFDPSPLFAELMSGAGIPDTVTAAAE
ncbi:patatin-like phospholipase family protein [Litoreibacter roseus]|uniref:Alpha/beta hydrolase n=1 Tax=Litoreibacter roseus TaxID=2601869 RepID=A0A6N6JLX2_9RHOB|nr:patatin-like phospholipase family protein [Litoreibacter roseus]GFE66192.1 alpha/beta hydrolase [Litoreibacter roseus]